MQIPPNIVHAECNTFTVHVSSVPRSSDWRQDINKKSLTFYLLRKEFLQLNGKRIFGISKNSASATKFSLVFEN